MQVERKNQSFLSSVEKKLIDAILPLLPDSIYPDHLTIIGLLGTTIIFIGLTLTNFSLNWLVLANIGFIIQWFGDSLDGNLARYRRIERKYYGFFVDHFSDFLSIVLIGIGFALSPIANPIVALAGVIMYLSFMILTLIQALITGVFRIHFGLIGPTEIRICFIVINSLYIFFPSLIKLPVGSMYLSLYDILGIVGICIAVIALAVIALRYRKYLSTIDPKPNRN